MNNTVLHYFYRLTNSLFHSGISSSTGDKMHALQVTFTVWTVCLQQSNEKSQQVQLSSVSELFSDLFLLSLCPVMYHPNFYYHSFYHPWLLHSGNFSQWRDLSRGYHVRLNKKFIILRLKYSLKTMCFVTCSFFTEHMAWMGYGKPWAKMRKFQKTSNLDWKMHSFHHCITSSMGCTDANRVNFNSSFLQNF